MTDGENNFDLYRKKAEGVKRQSFSGCERMRLKLFFQPKPIQKENQGINRIEIQVKVSKIR